MAENAPTVDRFPGKVFAVWCEDGPDAARLRAEHLDGHLAHVEARWERYILAGPVRPTDDLNTDGSLFLIVAEDEADALAQLEGDPYVACGMYAKMTVRRFTPAVGRFLGGVTWENAEAIRPYAARSRPDPD